MSSALREVTVGRARGRYVALVADFALVGQGKVLHVLRGDEPLCGRKGEVRGKVEEDARAVRVGNKWVCAECRRFLGAVAPPRRLSDD